MNDKTEQTAKGRVIIPYGRSVMALVVAHSLGKKGIEVIGSDSIDYTVLSFSNQVKKYFVYPDPLKNTEDFIDAMIKKIEEYKPTDGTPYVLMPIYKDTELFAKYKDRFPSYIKIACPEFETISKLQPKNHFAETMEELGLSSPKSWLPEDLAQLKELIETEIEFPILIKPYDQAGGRGVKKAKNKKELLDLWNENLKKYRQNSVIQEIIDGKDYCLTALFDHGECRASMAYRNLHRFPAESGAGILRETVDDSRFREVAIPLMKSLKWNGVAEFDFLWNEQDNMTPSLIEVNTRFWGGLFQSVESGIDFPWLLYKLAVDGTVENAGEARIGTRTKMPYIWLISAVRDVVKSKEDFKEIEKQGHMALEKLKDGDVIEGLKGYSRYFSAYIVEAFNFPKKISKFKQVLELGRTARNEFLSSDDPNVAFGVLFILSSLLKHGNLPDEVRF